MARKIRFKSDISKAIHLGSEGVGLEPERLHRLARFQQCKSEMPGEVPV